MAIDFMPEIRLRTAPSVHQGGPGDLRQRIVPVEQAVRVGIGVQRVGDEPFLGQVGQAVGVAVALEIREGDLQEQALLRARRAQHDWREGYGGRVQLLDLRLDLQMVTGQEGRPETC